MNTWNLQNIPSSGTKYAKLIKQCIKPPKGWILVGADFASLEDRISALTTKDPNKIKVYSGLKQYEVCINGTPHRITEDDVVNFEGALLTGRELYAKLQSSKP